MRGTLHTVCAEDVRWILGVTADRQYFQRRSFFKELGISADVTDLAEELVRADLARHSRLTRTQLFQLFEKHGLDCSSLRGNAVLQALSLRGVLVQGPVVPREDGLTREQFFVLADELRQPLATVEDPLKEFFVRYVIGHGPATADDFAWWSGLPKTVAHQASAATDDRLTQTNVEGTVYYRATRIPRKSRDPEVLALPSFDEYFLGYYDRTLTCALEDQKRVGPLQNGIVRPTLLSAGEVLGTWRHSRSGTSTDLPPMPELFSDDGRIPQESIVSALRRYHDFIA